MTAIATSTLMRLRIELLRRDMTQLDLAQRLGRPVSTLSSWLRGVAPAPVDLVDRIERALELPPGALVGVEELDVVDCKQKP